MSVLDVKSRLDIKTLHDQLEQMRDPVITKLIANLLDMWRHTSGEDIIVPGFQNVGLGASQTLSLLGGAQPATGQEWDIIAHMVVDVANIDVADRMTVFINTTDEISTQVTTVNNFLLSAAQTGAQGADVNNYVAWIWPNTFNSVNTLIPEGVLTLRETTSTKFRGIGVRATTTATAGTRRFSQFVYVRRRVL